MAIRQELRDHTVKKQCSGPLRLKLDREIDKSYSTVLFPCYDRGNLWQDSQQPFTAPTSRDILSRMVPSCPSGLLASNGAFHVRVANDSCGGVSVRVHCPVRNVLAAQDG
jgi:hypothetical protein